MAQIYLLSVLTLLIGGALAAAEPIANRFAALVPLADLAEQRRVVAGVGIASIVVGALKLFVRAPFDTVPVAGDLLPALLGIVLGIALFASAPADDEDETGGSSPLAVLARYRVMIGYASMILALVHFLFPSAVIL